MNQLWAVVSRSGEVALRYTTSIDDLPSKSGHGRECRSKAIWPLDREPWPHLGETVSFETGNLVFDHALASLYLVPAIKLAAQDAILAIAPIWRQLADLQDADNEAKSARVLAIAAIREQSNVLEAKINEAAGPGDIASLWDEVTNLSKGV